MKSCSFLWALYDQSIKIISWINAFMFELLKKHVLLWIHTSLYLLLYSLAQSILSLNLQYNVEEIKGIYKNTRGLLVQIWRLVFFEQDSYIHAAVPVAFHTHWTFKASEKISQTFCSMHKIQPDILIILPENSGHTTSLKYCMLLPNTALIAIHDPNAPL